MAILKINPVAKPRMTQSDKWNERPEVFRYRQYSDQLNYLVNQQNIIIGDTLEDLTFVIRMPKSWPKKKKITYCGKPHQSRPDLDNLVKAFKDSLLKEDSHIHTYKEVKKVWGYTGAIIINT